MSAPNPIWLSYERRRNRVEKIYKSKIYSALMNQVRMFTQHIKWEGIDHSAANISSIIPTEGISVILKALYIRAGLIAANTAYTDIGKYKFTGFGFNQVWTNEILNYFRLYLLNKAVLPITETTKNMIRTILEKAKVEGWNVDQTVKEILSYATEINRSRAAIIVRTESSRAMNVGSFIGAEKSTIQLDKKWITAHDERVRPTHRMQDGMVLDMSDTFPNGLAFPGDPNGSASEVINCRCAISFVPKRDASGRLIRKPPGNFIADHRQSVPLGNVADLINEVIQEGK